MLCLFLSIYSYFQFISFFNLSYFQSFYSSSILPYSSPVFSFTLFVTNLNFVYELFLYRLYYRNFCPPFFSRRISYTPSLKNYCGPGRQVRALRAPLCELYSIFYLSYGRNKVKQDVRSSERNKIKINFVKLRCVICNHRCQYNARVRAFIQSKRFNELSL